GLFLVVITLDQLFAGFIILARDLRRLVLGVIDTARSRLHAATGVAADALFVVDGEFDRVIYTPARCLQRFSLRNGARETIGQKAIGAIGLSDALLDQVDDQVVGNQAAGIHHALGLQAQLGTSLDRRAQHVARGNLRNAEFFGNEAGLGTFASTGRSQQNHAHG